MKKKRGIIVSIIVVIVICIIGYGVYSYETGKSEVNNTSNKSQDYTNEVNSNKNTTEKDNKDYSNKETNNKNNTSSKEDSNQKNVSSNSKNVTQLNNKSSKSSNTQKSESSNNQKSESSNNQTKKPVNNNDTSSNNNSNNNDDAYKSRLKALSGKYQDMESNLLDKYGHNKYGLITPGPGPETTKLETSYYNDWNNVLNSVWRDLKANLPESQMKNLTKQEVEWVKSKDGKDIGEQGQMTRDRAVYLLKKYIYQIS